MQDKGSVIADQEPHKKKGKSLRHNRGRCNRGTAPNGYSVLLAAAIIMCLCD